MNKENGEHAQDREIYSAIKAASQFGCPFWSLLSLVSLTQALGDEEVQTAGEILLNLTRRAPASSYDPSTV